MRVGVLVVPQAPGAVEFAQRAEDLGVGGIWSPETWGYDALTGLSWIAARTSTLEVGTFAVQLGSRSPALLAGSALSLQLMSGNRFKLGIGVSGPGVMEGWHGVRFTKPVQTTRETIEIVRMVSRGDKLEHPGEIYPLPLPDSRGNTITPMVSPAHVPIYVACLGPANLKLTGELADGYAFTIGAMGTGSTNFYNDAFSRLGFGTEITEVARLWKEKRRDEARAAVPLELGTMTNLVGTREQIADRVMQYRKVGINTLLAKTSGPWDEQLAALQALLDIVAQT